MVGCSSSAGSPGEVWFHVMNRPALPPIQPTPATVTVQLRIATDASFASFHPEAHLPLSRMQGRPVFLEVSLLESPDPNQVLLVHSCLAYTPVPYATWTPVYDSCSIQGVSQLLPSPNPHHIRRIVISTFLSVPLEGSPYNGRGYPLLQDPEIYFFCLTEVCSAADSDCNIRCLKGPNSDVWAKK
ncbi:zona pellucida sperm-binding protein 1-like [Acanthochromis polyacanthus]|uniref:zona pellucida sperm-binding protein 1-like n=1 Tax=Acanthochromis polyacanthus TaxID=80966 RepID=UPI0022346DEE|nr:zona pellucida sperm-binding protein 1-like [Acanthochromis polyacanthus]